MHSYDLTVPNKYPQILMASHGHKKMSENVVRQAVTALAVKNHLIMSIIYTFEVRSAHICRQFSGSLSCSIGQVIPLLAYIVRYFIVSHQLGCNKRDWTTIFYYHLHIVPISQRFEIMFVSQRGKKKKKGETACQWMECVNQGSESNVTTSSYL